MQIIINQWRNKASLGAWSKAAGFPLSDPKPAQKLFSYCPKSMTTPLLDTQALATQLGIKKLYVKDERARMGLGSFKALGAAYVIAQDAMQGKDIAQDQDNIASLLQDKTYIAASAGNHGLSVAAGAKIFGAKAVIVLSKDVPADFEARLLQYQATVIRHGNDYESSMNHAMQLAAEKGWSLLSDSSWQGYYETARRVMEGYLIMGAEITADMPQSPTHIFLQAGVGGLAAAMAAFARANWDAPAPKIIVVEPEEAAALYDSIVAEDMRTATGASSNMGRLDCKTPSQIALNGLARDADYFMLLSDEAVSAKLPLLAKHGLATSPSGGAGLAGLISLQLSTAGASTKSQTIKDEIGLSEDSIALCFLSEAA